MKQLFRVALAVFLILPSFSLAEVYDDVSEARAAVDGLKEGDQSPYYNNKEAYEAVKKFQKARDAAIEAYGKQSEKAKKQAEYFRKFGERADGITANQKAISDVGRIEASRERQDLRDNQAALDAIQANRNSSQSGPPPKEAKQACDQGGVNGVLKQMKSLQESIRDESFQKAFAKINDKNEKEKKEAKKARQIAIAKLIEDIRKQEDFAEENDAREQFLVSADSGNGSQGKNVLSDLVGKLGKYGKGSKGKYGQGYGGLGKSYTDEDYLNKYKEHLKWLDDKFKESKDNVLVRFAKFLADSDRANEKRTELKKIFAEGQDFIAKKLKNFEEMAMYAPGKLKKNCEDQLEILGVGAWRFGDSTALGKFAQARARAIRNNVKKGRRKTAKLTKSQKRKGRRAARRAVEELNRKECTSGVAANLAQGINNVKTQNRTLGSVSRLEQFVQGMISTMDSFGNVAAGLGNQVNPLIEACNGFVDKIKELNGFSSSVSVSRGDSRRDRRDRRRGRKQRRRQNATTSTVSTGGPSIHNGI